MQMFMIVPPVSPWETNKDDIQIQMGASSLSRTAGEAWRKHTRYNMEHVQRWFDKGYRLRRVEVTLIED